MRPKIVSLRNPQFFEQLAPNADLRGHGWLPSTAVTALSSSLFIPFLRTKHDFGAVLLLIFSICTHTDHSRLRDLSIESIFSQESSRPSYGPDPGLRRSSPRF
ncbi:hypothetical protein SISSUDRAFT_240093 [Sistotremastrum suecicum HHB10207 ss-3]|uniref:Uncharacterized protein n=1 Tax=Sistotremastrum suecicum HHB10207 ss-3 TaxID=1314776 RepID=A0A166GJJ7_9AGAM|nr:hypothetical protein SISSUDRAFT_240093 [Sistotremastrum suecicum HHB10207 ss-3]